MPGRAVCPALGPGTVNTVACQQATRGKRWSLRSRPCMTIAGHRPAQVPGWLAVRLRLGVMPAPSGQIPPPWAGWENEAPTTRAARRPVPGHAPGGTSAPSSNLCLSMSGRLPQTGQPTPAWGATAVDEPDRVTRARERAAEAKAHELEAHRRAEELHEEAAVTLERLGRRDLARAAL